MILEKNENQKIVLTIEARMSSTRLPGKVLKPLAGVPLLQQLISRVKNARHVDKIVLATTTNKADDVLEGLAIKLGIGFFRGSENDVLERLASAVKLFKADVVVSLTGDNPLIDPILIDDIIEFFYKGNYDYVSNAHMQHTDLWEAERTFPVGLGVQVYKSYILLEINEEIKEIGLREHPTFAIYHRHDNKYKLGAFSATGKYKDWNHSKLRLTIDTEEDYKLISSIFENLSLLNSNFSTLDAIKLLLNNPSLCSINKNVEQKIVYRERIS